MDYSLMSIPLLFVVTNLACCLANFAKTYYSKRVTASTKDYYLLNVVVGLLCAFILFALGGFDTKVSGFTLGAALAFGLVVSVNAVFVAIALNTGPLSLYSVIGNSSMIITALSGFFFYGESLSPMKVAGIVLMFVCCVLVTRTEGTNKKASLRWLFMCILAALTGALIGLIQKWHQSSVYRGELNMFLVTSFLVSSAISLGVYLVYASRSKRFGIESISGKKGIAFTAFVALLFVANAVGMSFNHSINLYLSGVVDSAVFFPIVNGCIIVFGILLSMFFYREKLHLKQWIGMAFGILSVVCLCI